MPDEFISGSDWQQSEHDGGFARKVMLDDVWPQGENSESDGAGDKDDLADGLHPILAIGGQTAANGRPDNLCGVVWTYDSDSEQVVVIVQGGFISRQYVANVLTYSGGDPNTFEGAPNIGMPVYVDDSDGLSSGVCLSLSELNDDDVTNPLAGWLWYCQDEYADSGVGGPNESADWPKSWSDTELEETEVCVMLAGYGRD